MQDIDKIEVGDRLRLNTKSIQVTNRKFGGISLIVKVENIQQDTDGVKLLVVSANQE